MIDSTIWEESALGTLIDDPATVDEVGLIKPADIGRRGLRELWSYAVEAARKGLGKQALINALEVNGILSDIGNDAVTGRDYIDYLITRSEPVSMPEFVRQIINASTNRRIIEVATLAIQKARENGDAVATIQWMAKEVSGLIRDSRDPRLVASLSPGYKERALKIINGLLVPFWEPPIDGVKKVVKFLEDVDMAIIAGQTGTGKSAILKYMGLHTALQGKPALILTFENSEEEVHSWSLSQLSQIDHDLIRDPRGISQEDFMKIDCASEKLAETPYYIREMGYSNINDVAALIRKFVLKTPVQVIEIDGLYLIGGDKDQEMYTRISNNTQILRSLAQEVHVPIVGTTQFSRQANGKAKAELTDLLFAGENASRQVWSITKPDMTPAEAAVFPLNKQTKGGKLNSVVVTLDVLKNTNGRTGSSPEIVWHKPWGIYQTLEENWRGYVKQLPEDVATVAVGPKRTFTPAPKPVRPEKPRQSTWTSNRKTDE